MLRIGIVVPRMGPKVYGGAEAHARAIALTLQEMGHEVDVVATQAGSADTWLPDDGSEISQDGGVTVRRFAVWPRQWLRYDRAVQAWETGAGDAAPDLMADLGRSPALLQYIQDEAEQRDWWLFIPYLFSPTVEGLPLVKRSILIPCLHDEPLARMPAVRTAFQRASWVWYNTPEEAELGRHLFGREGLVVGAPVSPPPWPDHVLLALRRHLRLPPRYLLYLGRLESGKGLDQLLMWYDRYRRDARDARGPASLVLAGPGSPATDSIPGVVRFGPVDEPTKWALYAGALAYCLPSIRESLSLGMLEAWSVGTPCLVRAGSPVTAGHIRRSQGGLVVDGPALFEAAVTLLDRSPALRRRLGASGRAYVTRHYSQEAVAERLQQALARAQAEREEVVMHAD
jgi:glycosyltransferase involved in cell wall biosynthesis